MNTKSIVSTAKAAPAAGPYSQATRTEQFVFAGFSSGSGTGTFRQHSGRHRAADAAVAREPVGRSGSRRRLSRKRPEDDRVSEKHERLRRYERNLRRVLQRQTACALDHRSRTFAKGRPG